MFENLQSVRTLGWYFRLKEWTHGPKRRSLRSPKTPKEGIMALAAGCLALSDKPHSIAFSCAHFSWKHLLHSLPLEWEEELLRALREQILPHCFEPQIKMPRKHCMHVAVIFVWTTFSKHAPRTGKMSRVSKRLAKLNPQLSNEASASVRPSRELWSSFVHFSFSTPSYSFIVVSCYNCILL